MQSRETWQPSKFVCRKGRLVASRDTGEVGVGSRLLVDLIGEFYTQQLQLHARGRLLDLGCGKVPLYEAYRDYVTENTCVDWENTLHKNAYLDFECDLTQDLPFAAGEFDTIILSDVLEHIPNPEHLWKEMSRVLAAQGKLLLNVPFCYWLHERPHDYYRYTEFALRRFVEESGLTLVHLQPIGGSPEVFADMVSKHAQFVPLLGKCFASAIQYITWLFVSTAIGRRVSAKSSQLFPLGYFLIAEKPE